MDAKDRAKLWELLDATFSTWMSGATKVEVLKMRLENNPRYRRFNTPGIMAILDKVEKLGADNYIKACAEDVSNYLLAEEDNMGTQYQSMEPGKSGPHGSSISPLLDPKPPEMEEKLDNKYADIMEVLEEGISIEELMKAVPEDIVIGDMLKTSFGEAKEAARKCNYPEIVSSLLKVGGDIANANLVATDAYFSDNITEQDRDDFLDKMVSFQYQTVMNEIGELLATNCECKV